MANKHYLTNVAPYDGIEICVAKAASVSGKNVFLEMGPMPTDDQPDAPLIASMDTWCLVLDQPHPADLTRFWNEYWSLKFEITKGA